MKRAIMLTKAQAYVLQARLDAAAGCPFPGINRGKGRHVPAAQSATLHAVEVREHPTNPALAAIPIDSPHVVALFAAEKVAASARVADGKGDAHDAIVAAKADEAVTPDWFPAPEVERAKKPAADAPPAPAGPPAGLTPPKGGAK